MTDFGLRTTNFNKNKTPLGRAGPCVSPLTWMYHFFSITAGSGFGTGAANGAGPTAGHGSLQIGTQIGIRRQTLYVSQYDSIRHVVCGTHFTCSRGTIRQVVYGTQQTLSSATIVHFLHAITRHFSSATIL